MAHIKWGMFVTMGRGKIGGSIVSHNAGGDYVKNMQIPTNPQTARQMLVRARNTQNAQAWRSLTDSQRNAWNSATVNFPQTNVFGDTFFLSGEQLYIKLNNNLFNIGVITPISVPPTPTAVTNFLSLSVTALPAVLTLQFTPTPTPVNQLSVVYATPPISQGISNFQRELRQITVFAGGAVSGVSIVVPYAIKYGVLPSTGTRVGVAIQPFLSASGLEGLKLSASTIQL